MHPEEVPPTTARCRSTHCRPTIPTFVTIKSEPEIVGLELRLFHTQLILTDNLSTRLMDSGRFTVRSKVV